jgi:hypothetical protein
LVRAQEGEQKAKSLYSNVKAFFMSSNFANIIIQFNFFGCDLGLIVFYSFNHFLKPFLFEQDLIILKGVN